MGDGDVTRKQRMWSLRLPYIQPKLSFKSKHARKTGCSLNCSHSNITPGPHLSPLLVPLSIFPVSMESKLNPRACTYCRLTFLYLHFQTWMEHYSVWLHILLWVGSSLSEPWPMGNGRWEKVGHTHISLSFPFIDCSQVCLLLTNFPEKSYILSENTAEWLTLSLYNVYCLALFLIASLHLSLP